MDSKILIFTFIVLLTSGCLDEIGLDQEDELPNRGFEIESYSITDNELRPNQQAVIRAEFRNYHSDIDVENIELTNYGSLLNVEPQGCSPDLDDLEGARDRIQPTMACTWIVEAPDEDALEGFSERREPVQMRVEYSASMENTDPLRVNFKPVRDIESTHVVSQSSSNQEVSLRLAADNPAPLDAGTTLEVVADKEGPGRLPDGYSFNFEPRRLFDDCEDGKSEEGLQDDQVNFVCSLTTDNDGTNSIFVSIDYKYVKEPTLDITLVNR